MPNDNTPSVESTALFGVWMPIETAQHDDATWVIVWDGDQIDIAIFGRHPLDAQEEMALCWTDGGRELQPTHWMPLPSPPNPGVLGIGHLVDDTKQPVVGILNKKITGE